MKCEIIKDLLPSYIDELTSDESNKEIENHMKICSKCRAELDSMKQDISIDQLEINKKDIQPLKKFNKKYRNIFRNIAILSAIAYIIAGFYTKISFDNVYTTRANIENDLTKIAEVKDINNVDSYSKELEKLLSENYKNVMALNIYKNNYKNLIYTYENKSSKNPITTNIGGDILTKNKISKSVFNVSIDYKPVIVGNNAMDYSKILGLISLCIYIILLLKARFISK